MSKPTRVSLAGFPDVVIHALESEVKRHADYLAAKAGDIVAAENLVADTIADEAVERICVMMNGLDVEILPIHALESAGVNEIPAALAKCLSARLGVPINESIVQINTVGHTGASGYHRMANQALFDGEVKPNRFYLAVDDFIGQGGTLANLIGFIDSRGSKVFAATVLTGKPYSAKIAPELSSIESLRRQHGTELENWWRETFGFGFDFLTRSEARYLENSPDADTIRNRLIAARPESGAELSGKTLDPINGLGATTAQSKH